jgi:LemA protein
MKNSIIVIAVLALLAFYGISVFNGAKTAGNGVDTEWNKVQASYQERADVIPNLVSTVKGAANFEQQTLTAVIEARAKATSITIDPSKATPEQLAQYQQAQGQLSQALGRLMVVSEQYPQLKANANFQQLQSKLEGIENGIKAARDGYSSSVLGYNNKITTFPANVIAGMFGLKKRQGFTASEDAQKAPEVKF